MAALNRIPAAGRGVADARTLLLVMAHHAHDHDPSPYCSKGDGYYAARLGYAEADPSGERAVRRARAVLISAGLVAEHKLGRPASFKRRWVLKL